MSGEPAPANTAPANSDGYGSPSRLFLPYEGPEPAWDWPEIRKGPFRNRKRGLGSSDAPTITGESKYKSPLSLYWEIRGEIAKGPTKFPEIAELGLLLEPVIMELYRRRTRRTLIDRGDYDDNGKRWDVRCHPEYPWLIANLDMEAAIGGGDPLPFTCEPSNGVVEAKSKDAWGDYFDENGNPTRDVMCQIQHQLFVSRLNWATACFLVGRRFYMVDVKAHEPYQQWLVGELAEFWERCWNGDAPDPDASPATADAILAKYPIEKKAKVITLSEHASAMIPRWRELRRFAKEAKEEKDEIENIIKFEMGDAEEAIDLWRTQGYSFLATKKGKNKWVVEGEITEVEQAQLVAMGGKIQEGKKGSRTLRDKKPENVGRS